MLSTDNCIMLNTVIHQINKIVGSSITTCETRVAKIVLEHLGEPKLSTSGDL